MLFWIGSKKLWDQSFYKLCFWSIQHHSVTFTPFLNYFQITYKIKPNICPLFFWITYTNGQTKWGLYVKYLEGFFPVQKLEETVAENARLEQELVVLRQKLVWSRRAPDQSVSSTAQLEAELSRVQSLVGDLHRQRLQLSSQVT